MPPKAKAKKNAGYKMAELVAEGTVVTDLYKKDWKVGPTIGKGGFGLIYLTQPATSSPVPANADYVMKMEPMENGPLFCEIACFQRALTQKQVSEYMKKRKMSFLGVPTLYGQGSHAHKNDTYRFMVMQRMHQDLDTIISSSPTHTLPPPLVFHVSSHVLDSLEYLHTQGYAHADIKAGNLMTGWHDNNQIFLIDYGLASLISFKGKHKAYVEDKKMAHNGTCLYTSRDAHKGAYPSARGDLEILGYCMWHWLEGVLPWQDKVDDPVSVAAMKQSHMDDIAGKIAPCIKDANACKILCKYLSMVRDLEYDQTPNYAAFTSLIKAPKPPKNAFLLLTKPSMNPATPKTNKKSSNPKSPRAASSHKPPPSKDNSSPLKPFSKSEIKPPPSTPRSGVKAAVAGKSASGALVNGGVRRTLRSAEMNGPLSPKLLPDGVPPTRKRAPKRLSASQSPISVAGVDTEGRNKTKRLPRAVRKVKVQQVSQAVQTSPGLLGLRKKAKVSAK